MNDKKTPDSRNQDEFLMNSLEALIGNQNTVPVAGVVRVHARSLQVAFPDGRVVTLVLYGPRGRA